MFCYNDSKYLIKSIFELSMHWTVFFKNIWKKQKGFSGENEIEPEFYHVVICTATASTCMSFET